jgi:hypothetical protein
VDEFVWQAGQDVRLRAALASLVDLVVRYVSMLADLLE